MPTPDETYFDDVTDEISEAVAASEILIFSPASRLPGYGKNEPYHKLVSWKDWERNHGVPRPYETPLDEYIQNVHTATRQQLELRWANMPEQDDIGTFWNTPKASIARARYQASSLSEEDISFSTMPETINRERYLDLLSLQAEKEKIISELSAEKRMVRERVGNPQAGYDWVEIERVVTLADKSQLRRDLIMVQSAIDAIREKPKIDGGDQSDREIGDVYIQVMVANNHVGSTGLPINDVRAEIARREREALDTGRTYDAQAIVHSSIGA